MSELHEILAVEKTKQRTAVRQIVESTKKFNTKTLFQGLTKTLIMFNDEDISLNTKDVKELASTVDEELEYSFKLVADYWDVIFQKDKTNQKANADIMIGQKKLASNLPATFLLGLEEKLNGLRGCLLAIPNLDPNIAWKEDDDLKKGAYITVHPVHTFKTKKVEEFVTAYEATEHHPAQVEKITNDKNVGKYTATHWSGGITTAEKAAKLTRLDTLINAVKQARQRANKAEVENDKISSRLLAYVYDGTI